MHSWTSGEMRSALLVTYGPHHAAKLSGLGTARVALESEYFAYAKTK